MSEKVMFKSFGMKFEADVTVSLLDNAGIQTWILDKQDSSYGTFGSIEVYIEKENIQKATELITSQEE